MSLFCGLPRRSVVVAAMLVTCALLSSREAAAQACDANHLINWPDANPVWQLCWTSPVNSTGIDGSGLEVSAVHYKGRLVLSTGHMPVLNVKVRPGRLRRSGSLFRDWGNELARFEADHVIRPGYAEPTMPPRTVCDNPGSDIGSFAGVAAEKLADRLILSTQIQAGWYRYVVSWTFFLDGTIQPGIRFTAIANVCTPLPHYHDVYWRLDFDLDGTENDAIEELNNGVWTTFKTETQRLHSPSTGRSGACATRSRATRTTPATRRCRHGRCVGCRGSRALKFGSTEVDDGGATGGTNGDQVHLDRYVTGEAIDGQDVVLYCTGFRHVGPADCELGGPTLRPARTPSVNVTANGQDLPLTIRNEPLRIDLAFDAAGATSINPSEVYIGVKTPFGTLFLDSTLHFVSFLHVSTPARSGVFRPSRSSIFRARV